MNGALTVRPASQGDGALGADRWHGAAEDDDPDKIRAGGVGKRASFGFLKSDWLGILNGEGKIDLFSFSHFVCFTSISTLPRTLFSRTPTGAPCALPPLPPG